MTREEERIWTIGALSGTVVFVIVILCAVTWGRLFWLFSPA